MHEMGRRKRKRRRKRRKRRRRRRRGARWFENNVDDEGRSADLYVFSRSVG
jgi:hypothetical protein